jgi:hypothetical protein
MNFATARTPDDMMTVLAGIARENRRTALGVLSAKTLRPMADLCGIDAEDLTKGQLITTIIENF